jgi:WhiB family redox-sensing transcriptional regulator
VTRHSRYLASFARTQCEQLPSATEDAWSWQLQGKCLGYPPEVFFPDERQRSVQRRHENAAKLICRQCPVVQQCRDHALRTPENHGVWGAMTASERAHTLLRRVPSGRSRRASVPTHEVG